MHGSHDDGPESGEGRALQQVMQKKGKIVIAELQEAYDSVEQPSNKSRPLVRLRGGNGSDLNF